MKTLEQLIQDVHKLQKYLHESGVYLELGYGGANMRLMTTHRVVTEWTGGRSPTYKLCGIAWLKGKEEPWQYHVGSNTLTLAKLPRTGYDHFAIKTAACRPCLYAEAVLL